MLFRMKRKIWRTLLSTVFAVAMLLSCGFTQPVRVTEAAGIPVLSGGGGLREAPVLTADKSQNVVRKPVELTFADDAAWRGVISAVSVDGVALDAGKYVVEAGKITINKSVFTTSKDYDVAIKSEGYADAAVTQTIGLIYITGDAVSREVVFTRSELAAMDQVGVVFSATNDFPYDLFLAVEGVPLRSLLERAGMKPEARVITFTGTDGYRAEFTAEELLNTKRYNFSAKTEVEPVIALKRVERSTDFGEMNEQETPVLCFGQRAQTEQTLLGFCKMVQAIAVTAGPPGQWDKPVVKIVEPDTGREFTAPEGNVEVKSGAKVYLKGSSPKTKIYYTTGGAEPDLDSSIFNAHGCGPLAGLDEPVLVDKATTIKAKAVWFGKLDSEIATFNFTVNGGARPVVAVTPVDGSLALPAGKTSADIQDNWAKADIEFLAGRGLVSGKSDHTYEPGGKITRAEFVALLVKALGLKEGVLKAGQFEDVADTAWYAGSVATAVDKSIIAGYGGNFFGPDNNITREEMAVMSVRAARVAGKEEALSPVEQEKQLIQFRDGQMISPWAAKDVALAVRAGIINGMPGGYFLPRTAADRAQSAAILKRFLTYVDGPEQ